MVTNRECFRGFPSRADIDHLQMQLQNMVVIAEVTGRDFHAYAQR